MDCIVLWVCDHLLDRNAHYLKASNKEDMCSVLIVVCSVVLQQMPLGWVIATCHSLQNFARVHPPPYLAGIFSCLVSTTIRTLQKAIPLVLILCDVWLLFTANFDVNTSLSGKHSVSLCLSFLNKLAWRPRFNPRSVCIGIFVGKVTLGLFFIVL